MLTFDATPVAQATAAPANGAQGKTANAGGPKKAADAFADLLSLLAGQPAARATKGQRHAGASLPAGDVTAFPFAAAAPSAPQSGAAQKSRAQGPATDDAATTAAAAAHADDDKALADNLTWLLALASAPKTDAAAPPALPQGGGSNNTQNDAPAAAPVVANSGPATVSDLPQAAPASGDAPAANTPDPSVIPGVQPRAAQSKTASRAADVAAAPAAASLDIPQAPPAQAVAADAAAEAAANAANTANAANAAKMTSGLPVSSPQERSTTGSAAAPAPAPSKANAAATAPGPAPVFVPVPQAESRSADGESAKREGRGNDERRIESSSLPKGSAVAPAMPVFQAPADVRVQAQGAAPAAEIAASSRVEIPAEAELPRQIVQAIRMQWADGVGDARIKLQPEYLGELSISIRVEHGAVTAALESNTPSVREWIDNNQPMLRQALAEHGLSLDRLTVTEEQPQPDWSGNEDPKQRQQEEQARQAQRARRRNDGDTPVFEMVA